MKTTPNAVILHGVPEEELWEYAPELAGGDGFSLAVTVESLESVLDGLQELVG